MLQGGQASPVNGSTAERPVLPVPGEVFALRKLLPSSDAYDFNVHVMDFRPGEALYVKASCAHLHLLWDCLSPNCSEDGLHCWMAAVCTGRHLAKAVQQLPVLLSTEGQPLQDCIRQCAMRFCKFRSNAGLQEHLGAHMTDLEQTCMWG